MKKLVDVAKDLHVTPQAIYKRKSANAELSARIVAGTIKRGKHTFLDDDAVSAILEAFSVDIDAIPEPEPEPQTQTILMVLQAQLAEKDRQIASLQLLLSQQQQLTMKTQLYLESPKTGGIRKLWDFFKRE